MRSVKRPARALAAVLFAGAGCAALIAGRAVAADADAATAAQPTQLGELIVSARQRAEAIQKVPAQDTAFTAKDIETKGVHQPSDFLSAVPNVTFIATQNA